LRPTTCFFAADNLPAVTSEDIVAVRRARTPDVPAIKSLVDIYAGSGRKLLAKELVALY
jgi:amino-acid N-acetyltransferase